MGKRGIFGAPFFVERGATCIYCDIFLSERCCHAGQIPTFLCCGNVRAGLAFLRGGREYQHGERIDQAGAFKTRSGRARATENLGRGWPAPAVCPACLCPGQPAFRPQRRGPDPCRGCPADPAGGGECRERGWPHPRGAAGALCPLRAIASARCGVDQGRRRHPVACQRVRRSRRQAWQRAGGRNSAASLVR